MQTHIHKLSLKRLANKVQEKAQVKVFVWAEVSTISLTLMKYTCIKITMAVSYDMIYGNRIHMCARSMEIEYTCVRDLWNAQSYKTWT